MYICTHTDAYICGWVEYRVMNQTLDAQESQSGSVTLLSAVNFVISSFNFWIFNYMRWKKYNLQWITSTRQTGRRRMESASRGLPRCSLLPGWQRIRQTSAGQKRHVILYQRRQSGLKMGVKSPGLKTRVVGLRSSTVDYALRIIFPESSWICFDSFVNLYL